MFSARTWTPSLARLFSTLVGRSGRVYERGHVLQAHPKNPSLNIHCARCEDRYYILKPTSHSIFEFSQELKHEFGNNPRLRTHIDENEDERVLVYKYMDGHLLSFAKCNSSCPLKERKYILREVALALQDLHSKNWIHLDLKPNNVMINGCREQDGSYTIERVVLGDLDCALKMKDNRLLNHRMGNVMWRSPEGQAGKGIGKPSEMFSLGLLFLFTITGAETLHPNFEQLKRDGIEPEHLILWKLLSMLGPAPLELITHIDDEGWTEFFTELSKEVMKEDSSNRLEHWNESVFPNLNDENKRMILRMMNLNPAKRATVDQIMEDPWWN